MNDQKYMWSYAGTALLISIWSQTSVQKQLKATFRNQGIWDGVARYMCRKGFNASGRQCRIRIKNILVRYRDAKKSGNITGTGIEPYFHDIDRVMTYRNTQTPSALPHVPPDPLASLEQTPSSEVVHLTENSETYEINVKNECTVLSSASEDNTQDSQYTPYDLAQSQLKVQNELQDDDQNSSANYGNSTERMRSPILNAVEKCEVVTTPSPLPTAIDIHEAPQSHRLEQLVVRTIESQTEAVIKILTAQHNLAKQLLEADRERQVRLEYKLENIISRLDQILPQLPSTPPSSASRISRDYMVAEERHDKLNRLLDKLDQVFPLMPSSASSSSQKELERIQEDKLERILNKLDQIYTPSVSTSRTSRKLNDLTDD